MTLQQYWRALRRRIWLLLLIPLAAMAVAVLVTRQLPPVYESDVTVLVRPAQPINSLDPNTSTVTADQVSRTYAQLMTQRPLLERVISDLNLQTTPERLSSSVRVTPQGNTTVLKVAVQDRSPTRARDIANKLVEDFIAQTKQIQQTQIDQYTAKIEAQLGQLRRQIQTEQARIDQLQARANEASGQSTSRSQSAASSQSRGLTADEQAELTNLQQQVALDRSQYAQVATSEATVEANVARDSDSVVVVAPAVAPSAPASPKLWLNLLIAAAGGLLLAVGLVLLLEYVDQSITTDEQLVERTGLLPLAHIPRWSGKRPHRELMTLDKDQAAEPYRTLRTNILFSSLDRAPKAMTITSAFPQEGKSRTAANLAIALAASGLRTVLVDCDFRRPAQHRLFGRVRNVGLSDLILGEAAETEAVAPAAEVSNLWVVTSGPTPPNPSELLGSTRMRELLGQLAARFTHVVIDTPPVNLVADALVLASYTDATLIVVEHGRSRYPAVRHAREALERVGARVLGAVVNKVASPERYGYYNYSYTYSTNGKQSQELEPADVGQATTAESRGRSTG